MKTAMKLMLKTKNSTLKNNIKTIYNNIDKAKKTKQEVKLLAVSKTHPLKTITQAISLGVSCFGENKIQEAEKKFKNKPENIELHFIGHLQKNKIKKALEIFDVIQTVDSLDLAEKINKHAINKQKQQRIYCQINIGNDPKKFGFKESEAIEHIKQIGKLTHLNLEGLMTILPFNLNETATKSLYQKMHKLYKTIQSTHTTCKELSMGMSNDYMVAIECGSTVIRVGTGLFGKRL